MSQRSTGPACGNNPTHRLTPGDRRAVENFKARLALQAAAKPYIDRAVWTDGDPLMEVIAVTLWERCARDDQEMPQAVRDDPRTIAAFAAAVMQAYTEGRTRADRAALRQRAEAALSAVEAALGDTLLPAAREEALAGIVAVLPPPADLAAVLRWAADHIEDHELLPTRDLKFVRGADWALNVLRRMADETAAAEAHSCGNCEGVDPDTCFNNPHRPPEQCPRSEADGYGLQCQKPAGHNLCTFEEQPAAGARQDEPDHVCNSVQARGEMDEPLGYLICGVCGKPKGGEA